MKIGLPLWLFAGGAMLCVYGVIVAETLPVLLTRAGAALICIVGFGLLSTKYST